MSQAFVLRAETGETTPAEGTLVRPSDSSRIGREVAFALAGFLGAAVCVFIPGVHLFTTWGLPLAGLLTARHVLNTRARIDGLGGQCPACKATIQLEGGRFREPMFEPCPSCPRNLQIQVG